jgi:hypothetical protein
VTARSGAERRAGLQDEDRARIAARIERERSGERQLRPGRIDARTEGETAEGPGRHRRGSPGGIEVAEQLVLSPSTVKTHFEHIYEKLGVGDRAAAVAQALRSGLIH